ncbi:MAG: cysteine desulfurase [Bacteroidales bacterium]|nr:cysteine desulfurase [Bacteroidales bacterium]MCF8404286.1 cysteine desulfurase [Bacteroidales bacterium]
MSFDIDKIRKDFPALNQEVYGKPLVYLDNAATSQKPQVVIDSISNYYSTINSNVHRGVHYLSQKATDQFEEARKNIQAYINATFSHEVIITKGATDSINMVASSFGKQYLKEGDEVIISALEHHANIVPWQMICASLKAELKVIPLNPDLTISLDAFKKMLNKKTKIVAISHISNALGIVNPVNEIIKIAHENAIPVLLDGAQGIVHSTIDVQELDCDFYCFSSHKFYGPMGVGILYGKEKWLNQMPPYQTGGEMIKSVSFEKTTFNDLPYKFETGTPNVADVIGFNKAVQYIQSIGMGQIIKYEEDLLAYANSKLSAISGVHIIAPNAPRAGVVSFNLDNIHPYDAGTIIDKFGVAVRTGNHCAQPVMDLLNIPGTIRASFAFYNTKDEVDRLAEAIITVQKMFG